MGKFLRKNNEKHERAENEEFSRKWISEKCLVEYEVIDVSNLSVPEHDKRDSCSFQVVWFKNIDRLLIMTKSINLMDIIL